MNDDTDLLRRYAEDGSEPAFAELVHRHVNLVYAAALRRTGGDPHRAEDVAQQVFTALARDARKLAGHPVLSAWLHAATRNAAISLMISEQRRQVRETAALETAPAGAPNPEWDRLRPLLDEAIDELPEADRAAVVLRFLERRPFAEVGVALQVSEDAARMRTDRALEKLRVALARRGITSTAEALGAIVSAQSLVAAPAGLAAVLAAQAVSAGGAGLLASLMTTKIITLAAVAVLLAFTAGTYVGISHRNRPETPPPAAAPANDDLVAALRQDNRRLASEVAALKTDVADLSEAKARLTAVTTSKPPAKLPTLGLAHWEVQRNMMNNLRQISAARHQYRIDHGQSPGSIEPLVGRGHYIKAVRTVGGEDYTGLSMEEGAPLTVTAPDGTTMTYDPSGATTTKIDYPPEVARLEELAPKVQPLVKAAVTAYQAAHEGKNPPNSDALLPYFATPQDGAEFAEFIELQKTVGP